MLRQDHRNVALLEMPREDREAHEQVEQVCQDHSLVAEMTDKPFAPGPVLNPVKKILLAATRPLRATYECGDETTAPRQQRQPEHNEIDRQAERVRAFRWSSCEKHR
jgi:hypothetical protein